MIYDVIIVWWWAGGLFAWVSLDKKLKKIILEKTEKIWTKVLLSGWWRANISNMYLEPETSYFTQNKKFLLSVFSRFNQYDTIDFFEKNWIKLQEEDNWRIILRSSDSKELIDFFNKKLKENNCEIWLNKEVEKIQKNDDFYEIFLSSWEKYNAKNIIISSWGKSFFQTWTTWDWYRFAKEFWLKIIPTFPWLCWITTKKDLSELSWISINTTIKLIDNKLNKTIYQENWNLLFTHFGLSWPIIFNTSNAIWEYLSTINENLDNYLKNLVLEIDLWWENLPKNVEKFFWITWEENNKILLEIHSLRSLKEAKATTWWIDLNELDNSLQAKKHSWLFFIWEVVDVIWKTWGFNLQWAWSSAFVCSNYINKILISN